MADETKKLLKQFTPTRTNFVQVKKSPLEIPNHSRGKAPESDVNLTNKEYVDAQFPVTHTSTTGQTTDDHHAETHTIVSHDTTGTGANVTTLTDNSMADALHRHSELSASDGTPDQAVYVDAAGNVGIGTTDPTGLFQVGGGSLTVLSNGNVGIGTTSPGSTLEVNAVGGATLDLTKDGTRGLIFGVESGGSYIGTGTDQYLRFLYDNTASEAMRIIDGGNVGIGTTSPGTKLHVLGATAATGEVARFDRGGSEAAIYVGSYGYHGVVSSENELYFNTNATDSSPVDTANTRMVILESGNVGIGTASPDGTLHVHTATAGSVAPHADADDLTVESNSHGGITVLVPDASDASINFGSPSDNMGAIVRWNHNADLFKIGTQNTGGELSLLYDNELEGIRIDSTGNVGIGTTSPTAKAHVDQASTTAAIPVLTLDQADISEEMIEFVTTIGTGNAIEAVAAKTLTTTHFIKVTLPGGLTRYIPAGTIA